MGTAVDIMRGGFSSGQARAIGGQVNSAISAAGTTISNATRLTTSINIVTTAAASSGWPPTGGCPCADGGEVRERRLRERMQEWVVRRRRRS